MTAATRTGPAVLMDSGEGCLGGASSGRRPARSVPVPGVRRRPGALPAENCASSETAPGSVGLELAARAHYPYDRIKAAEVWADAARPARALRLRQGLRRHHRGVGGAVAVTHQRAHPSPGRRAVRLERATAASGRRAHRLGQSRLRDPPDPSIILAALDRVAEQDVRLHARRAAVSLRGIHD